MSPVPPACPHVLGAPGSSTKPAVRRPHHHSDLKPLIRMEVNCQPMLRAGTRMAPAAGQGKLKVDEPQSSRLCNCSVSSEQVLQSPSHTRAARQLPLHSRPHNLLTAGSHPSAWCWGPQMAPGTSLVQEHPCTKVVGTRHKKPPGTRRQDGCGGFLGWFLQNHPDSAILSPFQAVTGGAEGRCLPPPALLLVLTAHPPGAVAEQRALQDGSAACSSQPSSPMERGRWPGTCGDTATAGG